MKKFSLVSFFRMVITLAACLSGSVFAVDSSWVPGECRPENGTKQYVFNFIKTVTDIGENESDKVYDNAFQWADNSNYLIQCNCPSGFISGPVYFKSETTLPKYKEEGDRTYYRINENLAFSMRSFIFGQGFVNVPFNIPNTGRNVTVCAGNHQAKTGSEGELDLLIIKPFIGSMNIPSTTLFSLYGTVTDKSFGMIPLAQVNMTGSVTVQQSCEVNAGNSINVDFGDMYNGDFKEQGIKPEGVASKKLQVGYKCNLVSKEMDVKMRFTGQSDSQYPTAFATTNPDIGVIIEDGNGNPLSPNTGTLPMTVDYDTQTGSVDITTYPVSTTGNIPVVGEFTSRATVVVDFQ